MSGEPRPQWRLLDSGPADGFINMAVDEALLEEFAAQGTVPTVRFYSWSPPAISLGYGQSITGEIDLYQCASLGIDVVRRPTGGRAVLHAREVTYSVVISADDPRVASGVLALYLTISQALVRGLAYLGITAELLPLRRGAPPLADDTSAVCFAMASSYEVAVAGRKIVGSAQRRAHDVIMQHGSIPIAHDLDTMRAVFRSAPRDLRSAHTAREYQDHMTSLQEAGGRAYSYAEVVAALTRGIAEVWQVDLSPGHMTAAESELSARLRVEKYGADAWTWRR